MEYIIFQIEGGIGKNILSTAVIRAINKKYPNRKIIVVTSYPDIWMCNPRIYKIIEFGKSNYFYNDFIKDKETLIFINDPYRQTDYIYRKKHLTEIWCDLCDVTWDGENPELYFTNLEYDFINTLINKTQPIFLIHPFGGSPDQIHKYSWARDIYPSTCQEIVNHMKKDYRVIQIRRNDQIALEGAEYLSLNSRSLSLSLLLSDKRLLIDSFMQHSSAAMGISSTVLWIANSPDILGYEINNNIKSSINEGDLRNSMYDVFDILGNPLQLSTPPQNIFKSEDIINILNN